MSDVVIEYERKEFPLCPEGVFQAVCCDVVDLGLEATVFNGVEKMKRKIRLYFQLDEQDAEGRRFIIAKKMTASLNDRAALRQMLEAIRGKAFTDDELRSVNLEKLIGVNCQLHVVHVPGRDGKTYAQIKSAMPIKGVAPIKVDGYVRKKDKQQNQDDESVPF